MHLSGAAELVVSELVTNSVRHAREPRGHVIRTQFERLGRAVRIEVHDANESKPEQRRAFDDEESGRGLALVDAITGGRLRSTPARSSARWMRWSRSRGSC